MKVHIVSYNLDQKKISKSKIHILPNYEQKHLKTATVIAAEYATRQPGWLKHKQSHKFVICQKGPLHGFAKIQPVKDAL